MNRLRNRLLLAFLVATLAPLCVSLWVTSALVERSLSFQSTRESESLSLALEKTGRELYQQARENLRVAAESGRVTPQRFPIAQRSKWPADVVLFWEGKEPQQFLLSGEKGTELQLLQRRQDGVSRYTRSLGGVEMHRVSALIAQSRRHIEEARARDLRRGFLYTLLIIGAAAGVVTIVVLVFFAYRISRPVQKLTDALQRFAAGDMHVRVQSQSRDEIGGALEAFNEMAGQLQQSRERLIMLTRLSSWQALGRKMAHEVKNSLTPIRLTVEEMAARQSNTKDSAFFDQAAAIIVDEVTRLEKRVRAFSDLAAEPPVHVVEIDINPVVEERAGFLRAAHPEVIYNLRLDCKHPRATADEDLLRGVLTNLLENAAEAAGAGGVVLVSTVCEQGRVWIEVHDSGPGLSLHAKETLFQPTISFKKAGMGLGLSIARKSALLSGGDIELITGELGGAAFRVSLPAAMEVTATSASPALPEPTWAQNES